MSVLNENTIIGASAAGGVQALEIDFSCRVNQGGGVESWMSRTPSTGGDRRKWTLSFWLKRGTNQYNQIHRILYVGYGNDSTQLQFSTNQYGLPDQLWQSYDIGASTYLSASTGQQLRDFSAWYHIVWQFDTAQATATDRAKIFINGVRAPHEDYVHYWNSTNAGLAQNSEWQVNKVNYIHHLFGSIPLDGLVAEVNFVDGQALEPDSFGMTGDYGEWLPIAYEGTYGTNGYHLEFKNASALGTDTSGNGNNWTLATAGETIAAHDQMLDTPSNNFATLNPIDRDSSGALQLYQGNLHAVKPSGYGGVRATIPFPKTGKWYVEYCETTAINSNVIAGIRPTGGSENLAGNPGSAYFYWNSNGLMVNGRGFYTGIGGNVIVQMAYDADTGKTWMGRNNVWLYNTNAIYTDGNPSAGTNPTNTWANNDEDTFWALWAYNLNGVANFGQDSSFKGIKTAQNNQDANGIGDFYYAPPTNFLSLCTKNLASVDVKPSENFNAVLYSGNGGTSQTVTGVGFPADFVWIKGRSIAAWHRLQNTVGGINKLLFSNDTSAEVTNEVNGHVSAVSSDGFNLADPDGNGGGVNGNGSTYVAWNWKAGGTAVSNTNGSITSSVSANPSAGFSIVSYTGTGVLAATIGHGLAQKPELIIRKDRDTAVNWVVNSTVLGTGNMNQGLFLNTSAAIDTAQGWMNNTAPTSTVFTQGDQVFVGVNGRNYIAYCFHSVDGHLRVGSYIGNGASNINSREGTADGTFVHCGFSPALIITKSTAGTGWRMIDNKRTPYNLSKASLYPDSNDAEYTGTGHETDFLSNGFKMRNNNARLNTNGQTYIFIAFAESPFKHSNAQ